MKVAEEMRNFQSNVNNKANDDNMMKHTITPLLKLRKKILHHTKPIKLLIFCTSILLTITVAINPGLRRSIHFWSGMAPLIIEYNFLKYQRRFYAKWLEDETDGGKNGKGKNNNSNWHDIRLKRFHMRAAPRITSSMISLGGIYVKVGQLLSMCDLLPTEYMESLQILQDGLPPRKYEDISRIIEDSTGRRMEDMFYEFDEIPIGAASIGQAHRAILKMPNYNSTGTSTDDDDDINSNNNKNTDGLEVIVKVQYPEVARDFQTDFNNVDLAARFIEIGNTEFLQAVRERHFSELDYRNEAMNLREVQANMRRHGVEPNLVRIPSVMNETGICNDKVLVMEYLEGVNLKTVIEAEHNKIAKGLGQEDAVQLKNSLRKKMREHVNNGGGDGGRKRILSMLGKSKLVRVVGTSTAKILGFYGGIKQNIENASSSIKDGKDGIDKPPKRKKKKSKTNLSSILKTLVYVHGLQLLSDGVFNVDPHPGNVLILPDGRLGLLDYGMVGRFDEEERKSAARLVLAISRKDKETAAQIYNEAGYRMSWKEGDVVDPNMLYRIASTHFDRLDLSDIVVGVTSRKWKKKNGSGGSTKKRKIDVLKMLESVRETNIPMWIENARRLNGLLIGITQQALRPISLCKEWKGIATQALRSKE